MPWRNWQDAEFETLRIDRAEPAQPTGRRPDTAYLGIAGRFLQCFPTKLTLAPDLGDQVLAALPAPRHPQPAVNLSGLELAKPPW